MATMKVTLNEKGKKAAEKEHALEVLRGLLPPGATAKTILRHVSRSGMSRSISLIVNGEDYTWAAARALGERTDQKNGGLKVGGCGMDMGCHLVMVLSATLYPDGFDCIGYAHAAPRKSCPSNDHSNGDRNYAADHHHKSGDYALRHEWL